LKIAVLVEYDDNFKDVAALTIPVLIKYCARHGYDLLIENNPVMKHDRGIIWHRVQHLLERLNDYDWLVHVDADVLVTNLNVPLAEFVDDHHNIILSSNTREDGSIHLNDGVLFIKGKKERTKLTLRDCWNLYGSDVLCAQDALEWMKKYRDATYGIKVDRQKSFNSFLYQEYGIPTTTKGQWTKGDFMLHMPGIIMKRRLEIIPSIEIIR